MGGGCRIGKVKMKNGGADIHIIPTRRTFFHESIENAAARIRPSTHAVGFFILDKNGTVVSGVTYDDGFTAMQLKGACEHMKDSLIRDIWQDE